MVNSLGFLFENGIFKITILHSQFSIPLSFILNAQNSQHFENKTDPKKN